MGRSWSNCLVIVAACLLVLGTEARVNAAPKKHQGGANKANRGAAKAIPKKSFDELDADKNGFLSMTEIFGKQQKKGSPARKAFDRADRDRNDWLDRKEFEALKKNGIQGGGKKGGGAKAAGKKKGGKKRR